MHADMFRPLKQPLVTDMRQNKTLNLFQLENSLHKTFYYFKLLLANFLGVKKAYKTYDMPFCSN